MKKESEWIVFPPLFSLHLTCIFMNDLKSQSLMNMKGFEKVRNGWREDCAEDNDSVDPGLSLS